MRSNSILKYIGFIGILILVVGIVGLSIQALRTQQDIRNQAAVIQTVDFSLSTGSTTIKPGQAVPTDIFINTKNKFVSGFTIKGIVTGVSRNQIALNLTQDSKLVSATSKLTETKEGTEFSFTFISNPASKSIFTTQTTPLKVATIVVTPSRSGSIGISLLPSPETVVVEHTKGYIAAAIGTNQSFVVSVSADQNNTSNNDKKSCNENCATDTECKSEYVCYKGRCRIHTNNEDDKCTVPPQKGLERTCNEYCADSRECSSSFTCYNNRCRLANNIGDTSCKPAPTATPRPATTTTSAVGGPTATTQPKGATPTPAPTTKPSTVTATVNISSGTTTPSPVATATNKPVSNLNNLVNFQSGQSTTSGVRTSPTPTPTPQIVPLPDELKPENVATSGRNNTLRNVIIIIAGLGILGLIGFGIYYWKNA